jgi:hypothetical protein
MNAERITVIFPGTDDEGNTLQEEASLFTGSPDVILSDYPGMVYVRIVKSGSRQADGTYALEDYNAVELPGKVTPAEVSNLSFLDYVRYHAVK